MVLLSLNTLCLREIVESFDRFNQVYCSGNAAFQRHCHFLQIVHSREILCMLCRAGNLKEEYLNFLLNPYLKELDLQKLLHCNWEIIREKIIQVGHGIQKLVMSDSCANELSSTYKLMNHVPNLRVLHLHHICTDVYLKILGKYCPNLIELDVNCSIEVSNGGIQDFFSKDENGICAHSTLQVLNLDGTRVDDEGVTFLLENVPSLQVIVYGSLPIVLYYMHKEDLDRDTLHKAKAYNLTQLRLLQSPHLNDIMLISIKLCPHMKNLYLPAMKQEEIDLFCKFTELQSVHLENHISQMGDGDLNNFLKVRGSGLTTLKLCGFNIALSSLAEYCPRLTTLKLSNCSFELDKDAIPSFKNLQEFILCDADFTDDNAATFAKLVLSSSPGLEKLSFLHCEFFNSELDSEILNCCTQCFIKCIDFTGSDVEYSLLKHILRYCTTLECLAFDNCLNLTSEHILFLSQYAGSRKNRPQILSTEYDGSDSYSDYDIYDPYDNYDFYDSYDDDDDDSYDDDYFVGAYERNFDVDDTYDI